MNLIKINLCSREPVYLNPACILSVRRGQVDVVDGEPRKIVEIEATNEMVYCTYASLGDVVALICGNNDVAPPLLEGDGDVVVIDVVPGAGARATSCLSHRCDEGNP